MMISKARMRKLEQIATGFNKALVEEQAKADLIDFSKMTDEELKAVVWDSLDEITSDHSFYDGMSDQELSDLYMQEIQKLNNEGTAKKTKKRK